MSSAGVKKRQRAAQLLAYKLRQQGLTNRDIAAQLGVDLGRVPTMVELGQRFASEDSTKPVKS